MVMSKGKLKPGTVFHYLCCWPQSLHLRESEWVMSTYVGAFWERKTGWDAFFFFFFSHQGKLLLPVGLQPVNKDLSVKWEQIQPGENPSSPEYWLVCTLLRRVDLKCISEFEAEASQHTFTLNHVRASSTEPWSVDSFRWDSWSSESWATRPVSHVEFKQAAVEEILRENVCL